MAHIANTVDKDQQADEGHHHQHNCRKWIKHPTNFYPLNTQLEPRKIKTLSRLHFFTDATKHLHKRGDRKHKRQKHGPDGNRRRKPPASLFGEGAHTRRQQRHRRYQPQVLDNPGHVVSTVGVLVACCSRKTL